MAVTWQEVRDFFFRAMRQGYAGKGKPQPVPDMPGFKRQVYEENHFRLVDQWGSNTDSNVSAGITTIWYEGKIVFLMTYSGAYDEEAIPFLKKALLEAYRCKEFNGGRGPKFFKKGKLIYLNHWNHDERNSWGREEIWTVDGGCLGFHEYCGGLCSRPYNSNEIA